MSGIWFTACRSPKQAMQTNTEIKSLDTSSEVKVKNDSIDLTVSRDVKWMKEWMNNFSFDFSRTETNWSVPDSTGKQHPTSTSKTTGKASGQSKGTEQLNDNLQLQYKQITQAIDTLSKRVELFMKQDQVPVMVEKKLSWWQTLFIWTGGIVWIAVIVALIVWMNKRTGWSNLLWKAIKRVV
jgi:hypothetical protein